MASREQAFATTATDRLLLRRPVSSDADACFVVHGDPRTNRFNPVGPEADLAASEQRLAIWLEQWHSHEIGYWIAHTRQGQLVGFGGVALLNFAGRQVLNLYFRLTPTMWGKGYATELGIHAMRLAAEHCAHLPIVARTRADNSSAAATAVRCGLVRRPDLDAEHHVYASNWPTA
jgi:ribosomal-protein-alanine N-acetyltransferase